MHEATNNTYRTVKQTHNNNKKKKNIHGHRKVRATETMWWELSHTFSAALCALCGTFGHVILIRTLLIRILYQDKVD